MSYWYHVVFLCEFHLIVETLSTIFSNKGTFWMLESINGHFYKNQVNKFLFNFLLDQEILILTNLNRYH